MLDYSFKTTTPEFEKHMELYSPDTSESSAIMMIDKYKEFMDANYQPKFSILFAYFHYQLYINKFDGRIEENHEILYILSMREFMPVD